MQAEIRTSSFLHRSRHEVSFPSPTSPHTSCHLLASGLDDFGTDFPNASEVGTFAFVISVELVLSLVLLADDVVVERRTLAAFSHASRFHFQL